MSDEELVKAVCEGNIKLFRDIVEKYQTLVLRIASGFVYSKEEAEDLSQEIWVRIFQSLSGFKGNAKFSTWLYRIAINASITVVNQNKRKQIFHSLEKTLKYGFSKMDDKKNPHQEMEETELNKAIQNAIDALPEKQRTAFILSKIDELSQNEIVRIMGYDNEGAVEQLLQRAKVNLRKKLMKTVGN